MSAKPEPRRPISTNHAEEVGALFDLGLEKGQFGGFEYASQLDFSRKPVSGTFVDLTNTLRSVPDLTEPTRARPQAWSASW